MWSARGGGGFGVTHSFVSGCCAQRRTDTDGRRQVEYLQVLSCLSVYGTSIPPSLLPIHPYIIPQRHNTSANPIAATSPRHSRPKPNIACCATSPVSQSVTNPPIPSFSQVSSIHPPAAILPRATTRTQKNRNHPQQQKAGRGWVCPSRHFGIVSGVILANIPHPGRGRSCGWGGREGRKGRARGG